MSRFSSRHNNRAVAPCLRTSWHTPIKKTHLAPLVRRVDVSPRCQQSVWATSRRVQAINTLYNESLKGQFAPETLENNIVCHLDGFELEVSAHWKPEKQIRCRRAGCLRRPVNQSNPHILLFAISLSGRKHTLVTSLSRSHDPVQPDLAANVFDTITIELIKNRRNVL